MASRERHVDRTLSVPIFYVWKAVKPERHPVVLMELQVYIPGLNLQASCP